MVIHFRAGDLIVGFILVVFTLYLAGSSVYYFQNIDAEIKLIVELQSVSFERRADSSSVVTSFFIVNPSPTVSITIYEYGVSLSLDRRKISSSQVSRDLIIKKGSSEIVTHQIIFRDNDRKIFEEIYSNAKSWGVEVVLRIREPLQFSPIFTLTRPIR